MIDDISGRGMEDSRDTTKMTRQVVTQSLILSITASHRKQYIFFFKSIDFQIKNPTVLNLQQ